LNEFKEDLKPYDVSKGTIHFPVDKPLPATLIKKMVKAKLKENEVKLKFKSTTKKTTKGKNNLFIFKINKNGNYNFFERIKVFG
jgi:hypothetical protein